MGQITIGTFERAVARYFEPIGQEHGWRMTRRTDNLYEVFAGRFVMRIRFEIGAHRKGINATLIPLDVLPGDVERGGCGELGVSVIAGYNDVDIQYIPWEQDEKGFFEQAEYFADLTRRFGVPYLLGQKSDWDGVKNYIEARIDERKKEIREVRFPSFLQKRWHLPGPKDGERSD